MKPEFIGILDIPEGLVINANCMIKDGWYFIASHPDHPGIYTLYKIDLLTAQCAVQNVK